MTCAIGSTFDVEMERNYNLIDKLLMLLKYMVPIIISLL
jgi:hypothetical protein